MYIVLLNLFKDAVIESVVIYDGCVPGLTCQFYILGRSFTLRKDQVPAFLNSEALNLSDNIKEGITKAFNGQLIQKEGRYRYIGHRPAPVTYGSENSYKKLKKTVEDFLKSKEVK